MLAHTPGLRAPLEGRHACHALVELADTHDFGLGALLESTLGRALADGRIDGAAVCTSDAQRANVWKIREGISQAQVRAGRAIKHDIALPISALPVFVREAEAALRAADPAVHIVNFGHLGDGNLHFNVLLPLDLSLIHI